MGGHQPYVPIGLVEYEKKNVSDNASLGAAHNIQNTSAAHNEWKQRARVLCSYDAKDSTELNLNANEVCSPDELNFNELKCVPPNR